MDVNRFKQAGANFTGVNICMNIDPDQDRAVLNKTQKRYKRKKSNGCSITRERLKKNEKDAAMNLSEINAIYPQCSMCKYHFKSKVYLRKHICGGAFLPKDALNVLWTLFLPLEISQYLAVLLVYPLYSLVQTVQCMLP